MAMLYQPRPGNVVMCDYRGFVVPEMVKVRPVVVIARNRRNRRLVTVVPLSTTEPNSLEDHHHALANNPLPGREAISCWAKCDMVMNLGTWRLDGFKVGRRKWENPSVTAQDLQAVRRGVLWGLGMGDLLPPPV